MRYSRKPEWIYSFACFLSVTSWWAFVSDPLYFIIAEIALNDTALSHYVNVFENDVIGFTYVCIFQKYYHGEYIAVNVLVDNNSNKTVKKIKVSGVFQVDWFADKFHSWNCIFFLCSDSGGGYHAVQSRRLQVHSRWGGVWVSLFGYEDGIPPINGILWSGKSPFPYYGRFP